MAGYRRVSNLIRSLGMALFILCTFSSFADDRFSDNGDGTVTDHQLNLMWSKSDNQGDINWEDAGKWVKFNLFYLLPDAKYDDWRLPTVRELRTLFIDNKELEGKLTDCGMRVKIVPQINLSCGWVWSSEAKDISANVFTYRLGYHFSDLKMHQKAHRVLAVRNIKK